MTGSGDVETPPGLPGNAFPPDKPRRIVGVVLSPAPSRFADMPVKSVLEDDVERQRRVIRHATQAFFARGYAAASLDAIAADAGVSKLTLYRLFGGKMGLAMAVLQSVTDKLERACQTYLVKDAPLQEGLEQFGLNYLRWLLQPIGKSFNYDLARLLIEISTYDYEYTRIWAADVRDRVWRSVGNYIRQRISLGEKLNEDPDFIAGQFIGNLSSYHMAIIRPERLTDERDAELEALVKRKVRLLLRGCMEPPT